MTRNRFGLLLTLVLVGNAARGAEIRSFDLDVATPAGSLIGSLALNAETGSVTSSALTLTSDFGDQYNQLRWGGDTSQYIDPTPLNVIHFGPVLQQSTGPFTLEDFTTIEATELWYTTHVEGTIFHLKLFIAGDLVDYRGSRLLTYDDGLDDFDYGGSFVYLANNTLYDWNAGVFFPITGRLVPEPSSTHLMLLGLLGLACIRSRRWTLLRR